MSVCWIQLEQTFVKVGGFKPPLICVFLWYLILLLCFTPQTQCWHHCAAVAYWLLGNKVKRKLGKRTPVRTCRHTDTQYNTYKTIRVKDTHTCGKKSMWLFWDFPTFVLQGKNTGKKCQSSTNFQVNTQYTAATLYLLMENTNYSFYFPCSVVIIIISSFVCLFSCGINVLFAFINISSSDISLLTLLYSLMCRNARL